jgi:hypothetical protein
MTPWYWAIGCDNAVANPLVTDSAELGVDPEVLDIGRPVEQWSELAWLRATRATNEGTPDDVLQNHLGLPIFSPRLRGTLEDALVQGIQYLPVRLYRPNGQQVAGFSIANIVERRAALDRSRSDCDLFPGDYFLPDRRGAVRGIRRAVLRASALHGCDIVRLDDFPASVYVSEKFRTAFESGAFTGYSFRSVLVY